MAFEHHFRANSLFRSVHGCAIIVAPWSVPAVGRAHERKTCITSDSGHEMLWSSCSASAQKPDRSCIQRFTESTSCASVVAQPVANAHSQQPPTVPPVNDKRHVVLAYPPHILRLTAEPADRYSLHEFLFRRAFSPGPQPGQRVLGTQGLQEGV